MLTALLVAGAVAQSLMEEVAGVWLLAELPPTVVEPERLHTP